VFAAVASPDPDLLLETALVYQGNRAMGGIDRKGMVR
jgi:hypothetical protein